MLDEKDTQAVQKLVEDAVAGKVISFEKIVEELKAGKVVADAAAGAAAGEKAAADKAVADKAAADKSAADKSAADKAAADKAAAAEKKTKRDAYLKEKAAKLPPAYRAEIPDTDDPAALDAGIAAAFERLKKDAQDYGFKLGDVGSAAGGGTAANSGAQTATIAQLDANPTLKAEFIQKNGIQAYLTLAARK